MCTSRHCYASLNCAGFFCPLPPSRELAGGLTLGVGLPDEFAEAVALVGPAAAVRVVQHGLAAALVVFHRLGDAAWPADAAEIDPDVVKIGGGGRRAAVQPFADAERLALAVEGFAAAARRETVRRRAGTLFSTLMKDFALQFPDICQLFGFWFDYSADGYTRLHY